ELTALADLVRIHEPASTSAAGNVAWKADPSNDFVGCDHRLSVAGEEVINRNRTLLPACHSFPGEYNLCIESKKKRRHVGYRRGGHNVARECRPVPNLSRREGPQHLVDHWIFACKRFFERRKRSAATNTPNRIVFLNGRELPHTFS